MIINSGLYIFDGSKSFPCPVLSRRSFIFPVYRILSIEFESIPNQSLFKIISVFRFSLRGKNLLLIAGFLQFRDPLQKAKSKKFLFLFVLLFQIAFFMYTFRPRQAVKILVEKAPKTRKMNVKRGGTFFISNLLKTVLCLIFKSCVKNFQEAIGDFTKIFIFIFLVQLRNDSFRVRICRKVSG